MQSCPVILVTVFVITTSLCGFQSSPGQSIILTTDRTEVGTYERLDFKIDVQGQYANPFDPCEVQVDLMVDGPAGRSWVLPAFYGQDYQCQNRPRDGKSAAWYYPKGLGSWKARFTPIESGPYLVRASMRDRRGQALSTPAQFQCLASGRRGFVRVSGKDPRFLEFSDGSPFFAIGQNLAFIGEGQYVTMPKAEQILDRLAANGANFVRVWTCCQDWALAIEARTSAWTRSWMQGSPAVPMPGHEDDPNSPRCVRLRGDNGASITMSPSHPVSLQPQVRYVIAGRFKCDGCKGLRLQVGSLGWDLTFDPPPASDWQAFRQEFVTGVQEYWLGLVTFRLKGTGTVWLNGLSLKEASGSAELLWEADVDRPVRGIYNPLDCAMLDQLVEAAGQKGVYLMLCLIARDLYMGDLAKVDSPEYRRALADAKKLMRYVVARWGCSTSVAAWEYFNEMDPGRPTDPFYEELGRYVRQIDIYGHLRTTSTWAPSARDCRHPDLDIAQVHHYMRPDDADFKDEVACLIEQTRFLRQHAPNKPALIGEFGLATPNWGLSDYMKQDTQAVHFHNCLWASAFAGGSGTAMFWWWEQLDQQDAYGHYKSLSSYLQGASFAGLRPATALSLHPGIQVLGHQGDTSAYLWLFNQEATWWNIVVEKRPPSEIRNATLEVRGLRDGCYRVQWWDTRSGLVTASVEATADHGALSIQVPAFICDVACKIMGQAPAQQELP